MAAQSYRYALLGVVGLVALVAIFTIIKTTSSSFTLPDTNILGMAGEDGEVGSPASEDGAAGDASASGEDTDPAPFIGPPVSSASYYCGPKAHQPYFCNGGRACCGGDCVELPSCEGKPNGPIYSCGVRQMYCCHGSISLMPQCPTIADDSGFGPAPPGGAE